MAAGNQSTANLRISATPLLRDAATAPTPMQQLVQEGTVLGDRIEQMPQQLRQANSDGNVRPWGFLEVQQYQHIMRLEDLPTPRFLPAQAEWTRPPTEPGARLVSLTPSSGSARYRAVMDKVTPTRFGFVCIAEKEQFVGPHDFMASGVKYALKFCHADRVRTCTDAEGQYLPERPCREIQAQRLLSYHPNMTRLHSVLGTDEYIVLVYEYNAGGDIYNAMATDDGRIYEHNALTEDSARRIFHQLVLGVQYMHARGIVHRDLSLENAMVSSEGTVKLIDFGMCTSVTLPQGGPIPGQRLGKDSYMAPETYAALNQQDARKGDVWCLAVMLFVMLFGGPPYVAPCRNCIYFNAIAAASVVRVIEHRYLRRGRQLSSNCLDLLSRILQADPAQRYSIDDVLAHPWLAGLQASLPAAGTGLPLNVNANQQELVQWLAGATAEAQRAGGRLSAATVDAAPGAWGAMWRKLCRERAGGVSDSTRRAALGDVAAGLPTQQHSDAAPAFGAAAASVAVPAAAAVAVAAPMAAAAGAASGHDPGLSEGGGAAAAAHPDLDGDGDIIW